MKRKEFGLFNVLFISMIIMTKICEDMKEDIDFNELLDRSHFKNYSMRKQFYIVDPEPNHHQYYYFYYFNMLGKTNKDPETQKEVENEFYMDMYYYDREYPKIPESPMKDLTQTDHKEPQKVRIESRIISTFKIKSDFYKAEINITNNDCLTLFFYLDSQEKTTYKLYPSRHDVYFDLRESKHNNFPEALNSYYGHSKESFDLIYNDLETEDDVFLKVVCPYFSNFGSDSIDFEISFVPHDYKFEGFNGSFCLNESNEIHFRR